MSLTELSRSWLVVAWLSVVEDLPRDGASDEDVPADARCLDLVSVDLT